MIFFSKALTKFTFILCCARVSIFLKRFVFVEISELVGAGLFCSMRFVLFSLCLKGHRDQTSDRGPRFHISVPCYEL